mmetsp:Transcript_126818/g.218803  ORF Transcript_126818/g.218803 Transcript_126818/m.218803 type:complete len:323 (+) Transcript_126818:96-1064(+)
MAMMELIPLDGQTKNMVLALMNGEHPDAIRVYARHFAGKKQATSATLTDVGDKSISLRYSGPGREQGEATMPYVNAAGEHLTVRTIGDCRRALVGMARIAAEALGEKIELPEPRSTDLPGGADVDSRSSLDLGPHREELQQIIRRLGADSAPPPEEMKELISRMQQLKSEVNGSQGSGPAATASTSSSSAGTVIRSGATAPARHDMFKGEGSRLGSSADPTPSAAVDLEGLQAELREVDPERPVVRLRVQLLDRRPAQLMVNSNFTLRDLRAWLEHYQGSAGAKPFHLMEVSGFPPRKLSDFSATIEEMGLTRSSSLACRPA